MKNKTIRYYSDNSKSYIHRTMNIDMGEIRKKFCSELPHNSHILDAGCGSGRDVKAFLEAGYKVSAFDACQELANYTSLTTGVDAKIASFIDYKSNIEFEGIWANASLLHQEGEDLERSIKNLLSQLRQGGRLFMSFKYGSGSKIKKDGRLFRDMNYVELSMLLEVMPGVMISDMWISHGNSSPTNDNTWLNCILFKV